MATPRKTNFEVYRGAGCFICGREEPNSRKRHSLGGKNARELQEQLLGVLPVTKELLVENANRYICDISCVKDVCKYYKLKDNLETLKFSLVQRFKEGVQQRVKRRLPSDVQPHQSPLTKRTVTSDTKTAGHSHRKLQFDQCSGSINRECGQNPRETQPFLSPCPPMAPRHLSYLCVDDKVDAAGLLSNSDTSQIVSETCNSVDVSKFCCFILNRSNMYISSSLICYINMMSRMFISRRHEIFENNFVTFNSLPLSLIFLLHTQDKINTIHCIFIWKGFTSLLTSAV